MQVEGKLWTGLITEPRPEEPRSREPNLQCPEKLFGLKFWSTDMEGNDVVKADLKEKKAAARQKIVMTVRPI